MASLWHALRVAMAWLERHAEWLLVCGLIAAGVGNWYRWRRDKERAREVATQGKPASPVSNETPRVSILLPAWNEAANIGPCIQSILALRYPDIELVVCAGGDDHTFDAAGHYAASNVVVLEQYAGEGKQRALRRCFGQCTGEIIFLTDADCQIDDACFEGVLSPILAGKEHAVTGAWKPLNGQVTHPFVQYQWVHHLYREMWLPAYPATLDGRNAAVRREALESVGAFEMAAPIGTDYVLSKQLTTAGYRIRFVRESRVQTEYPETPRAYWKQQSRWFRNPLVLGRRWAERGLVFSRLRAGSASVFLLAVPMVGGLGSKFLWYPWMVVVCHLVLSQLRQIDLAEACGQLRLGSRCWYFRLVPYMAVGWIATTRAMVESLDPRRRWMW